MRNFVISLLIILILATSSYAAPCYGTKMPEKKEIFLGLQYHDIFKRYLKDHYGTYRSMQNFLLLSYGIFDWLSIDLKGGVREEPFSCLCSYLLIYSNFTKIPSLD